MFRKKGPLVVFFLLIIVLIFIIGVRYGQNVERANKVINYIFTLTPSVSSKPQPINWSEVPLKQYVSKGCGIAFLYPALEESIAETNGSAQVSVNVDRRSTEKSSYIMFDCSEAPGNNFTAQFLDATQPAKLNNLTIQKKEEVNPLTKQDDIYIKLTNPVRGNKIYIRISPSLYLLFEETVEFN